MKASELQAMPVRRFDNSSAMPVRRFRVIRKTLSLKHDVDAFTQAFIP